jgi:hypothetical protein
MRQHGIPSDEAPAAAATAAQLAPSLTRAGAARRSPNLAARRRRRAVPLALANGLPQRRSLAAMEEEDLGVLDSRYTAHGPAPSGSPCGLYVYTDYVY